MFNQDPKHRPQPLADVLKAFLKEKGLEERVKQAEVVPEWPTLVGTRIAAVTEPLFVTNDRTLFVAVDNHAWMSELQLMEPELLRAINVHPDRGGVRKLRFVLRRERSER